MRPAIPLPEPLDTAPFTIGDALGVGVSYGRLRNTQLARPSRGIRIPEHDGEDGLALLAAPLSRVTEFSAAAHATAFTIWEFPGFLPGADGPDIHISRPDTVAVTRRRGVVGHRAQFFEDEVCRLNGLRITTRARTWLDVSRKMSVDELTVVADHLVRIPRPQFEVRSEPYATLAELAQMLDRHKGTPGIRKARLALEQARLGSDSAPETRLRPAIVRAGLPEPVLNGRVDLADGAGREPDLSFPEYRVAAEYEGEGHSDPDQIIRDISREEDFIRADRIQVWISKRHMVNDAKTAVAKIRAALLSRGWSPRSGPTE
ncbi:hypothetical protein [Arthrobacter sp. A5]|uniref:hypothetical protein n=1 Tax=Arthrobacter sp. A5 TaxID=576926 RepID=UPI003DA8B5EA